MTYEPHGLLEESPVPCDFKVGDKVIYTNDYGREFDMIVVGFSEPVEGYLKGGFIHMNTLGGFGAWWFPHTSSEIRKK